MFNLPIKILKTVQIQTAQASVTFSAINTLVAQWDARAKVTSRHLVLIVNAASPDAVAKRAIQIRFNGDAGANYTHQTLTGEAAVGDADRQEGRNYLFEYPGGTDYPFAMPGTTYANAFGGGMIVIPHAFNTVNHKTALALGGAVEDYVNAVVGRWASVAAITSVILYPSAGNFAAGSTFHLGVVDERYLVQESLLVAPNAAITFANIPQGEGDLALIAYARSDVAAVVDDSPYSINNDTVAANYFRQYLEGIAAGVSAGVGAGTTFGRFPGAIATANSFGAYVMIYSQYTKNNQPHFLSVGGLHELVVPSGVVTIRSGRRGNVEAINKLRFTLGIDNFVAGSLFSLYRVPKRIIQRQELTAPQATVVFNNIPQNFEALVLHVYTKTDRAAASDPIRFTINADAVAANYDTQKLDGTGAVVTAARSAADQDWLLVSGSGGGVSAQRFDGGSILFPAYNETDRHKHCMGLYGVSEDVVMILSARWESLTAITSISMTPVNGPNFLAGSVFELEGILRKEGLPPSEGMRV